MITTIEPYSLLFLWKNGVIVAAQHETKTVVKDDDGDLVFERPNSAEAVPIDISEALLGQINSGLLVRIAEIDTALATATAEKSAAEQGQQTAESERDTLTAQLEAANARIAELTAPPVTSSLISALHAAFTSTLPAEAQVAFAAPYAIVRTLVQADQMQLAADYIASVPVPPELEAAKQSLIDLITGASPP